VTPAGPITVVTFSGHRQAAVADSHDFRTWRGIADRAGRAWCIWAGPSLVVEQGRLRVIRRRRRPGLRSLLWLGPAVWTGWRVVRAATRRGETVALTGAEQWGWLAAWLVSRLTGRPWCMEILGDYFGLPVVVFGRWRRAVLRWATVAFARRAGARRVVAHSVQHALAERGIHAELVPSVLQAVWEEPLPRLDRPVGHGGPVLVTVGRLALSKGYDLLIDAMTTVKRTWPGARLRIVGDGPEASRLRAQVAASGLSDSVMFLGAGDVGVVRSELAPADLFVVSSRDEGLPRTLLEAAAAGLPIVATSVGGIPAAAGGWPTTTIVSPQAPALAYGILRALAHPPRPEQLAAVRRWVIAEYGFATNLDARVRLYRTLTTEGGTDAHDGVRDDQDDLATPGQPGSSRASLGRHGALAGVEEDGTAPLQPGRLR
jgi:glycosyltransferase involved in cell wall biosynthesis